jgi:hypothetical protein
MKPCEKEPAVLGAMRAGQWEKSLRDHVAACSACADLVLVRQFMDEEAKSNRRVNHPGLPSPGLIWWKAQMLSKRAAAERAIRPIKIVEKAAFACAPLGLAGMILWKWTEIQTWVAPLRTTWTQIASVGATPLLNPFLYMSAGVFLLLILLAFALYVVWAEG